MSDSDWWRGGIIYQIYPRSFYDSNNDGVGDIAGIIEKLDYVASIGVDAIWISPFFASPMKDFGYDVSDYTSIEPVFGTMHDFDALLAEAKKRNIKTMIDLVLSHTSDQHEWFEESRSSRDNPKADWYVWADPKPDGTPPNNWLSIFGGTAWEWDTTRRQYYMHNFLSSQPDLNYHNPEVRKVMLEVAEFWLERGVEGFRMDTSNYYFHDSQLRDNPPNDGPLLDYVPESNPYNMQQHIYNKTQPESLRFLEDLRALLDKYPNTASIGEISAAGAPDLIGCYTKKGRRLNMVYTFNFLTERFSVEHFRETVEYLEERIGDGWPCWAFGNHDVERVISRWSHSGIPRKAMTRFLVSLFTSLRGSFCMYQGDELGLAEADIPFDKIQDPYGIRFWPKFKGRDGCRTPMPWEKDEAFAGFSQAEPWLPVPEDHIALSVDTQDEDQSAVLNQVRRIIKWRKQYPVLSKGSIKFIDTVDDVLAFEREYEGKKIVAYFNFTNEEKEINLSDYERVSDLGGLCFTHTFVDKMLKLHGFSVFFAEVE